MKNQLMQRLPLLGAMIALAIACSGIGIAKTTQPLQDKVRSHIEDYYNEDIGVKAGPGGNITLSGEVATLFDKLRIGEIVSEIDGVHEIINNISIHNDLTADAVIQANVENELQRNNAILEPEKITVAVKDGTVHLTGSVSFFREKVLAQTLASQQDGVSEMVSDITVLSPGKARSDSHLTEVISDLLARFYPVEKKVQFSVHNGVVALNGVVRTPWVKNHIQSDVERLVGVKSVFNGLIVTTDVM
jgi:osmotically-inducible protein OsmY